MVTGKRSAILILAALLTILWYLPALAMPPEIQSQLHPEKELKILVLKGRPGYQLDELARHPDSVRILVVQMKPEDLSLDDAKVMLEWVRSGGTLWFYDSRLAHYFGMESAPLEGKKLTRYKEERGTYGDIRRQPGIGILALPASDHQVLTGVTGVVVFLLDVGKGMYSAVKTGGEVVALLKVKLDEPVAVSAIRSCGKGHIIFKPLLWEKAVDGDRFQANLKEFSAGFPVPKVTGFDTKLPDALFKDDGRPMSIADLLYLKDGRVVRGKVANKFLVFETVDRTLRVPPDELHSLDLDTQGGVDRLESKDGDKVSGFLNAADGIYFRTPGKKIVKLQKSDFKKILFNVREESGI